MKYLQKISFWRKFMIIILGIILIPMIWIAFYNHSCADDFSYGMLTRHAWIDTHNILSVLKAAAIQIKTSYLTWQGTFSAITIFALQPAIWGERFYFLSTFILLAILMFGTFYFFRVLVGKICGRKDIADIISCVTVLLSTQLLPSPVQGFFWWNGSSFYVIFHSIMLIQTAWLIKIFYYNKCSKKQLYSCMLIGFILAGSNYVTALLIMEITVLFFIACTITKKSLTIKMGTITVITLIGFLINVLAPGNAVRQRNFVPMEPIMSVLYSFHMAYKYMVDWTSPILIIALIFLSPFIVKLFWKKNSTELQVPLIAILILLFAVFASSFTPTLYAFGGSVGDGRVQNIRFFLWVIFCIMGELTAVYYVMNICKRALGTDCIEKIIKQFSSKRTTIFFLSIIFCTCFFVPNFILCDNNSMLTSISAAHSLYNGEAKQYDSIALERIELLSSDSTEVELPQYTTKPYVLFFDDIQPNADDWKNIAVAQFYRKDKVYLKEN